MILNPLSLALVGLRAAAFALDLQGQSKSASTLYGLADAAESGKNVDAHMAMVAEKLKSRPSNADDWADVTALIQADSGRLQA